MAQHALMLSKSDLATLKDIAAILQASVTVLAIFVGGFWSYLLLVRKRQIYPRSNLSHTVTWIPLTDRKALVHVCVSIFNAGEVLLSFYRTYLRSL